MRIASASLAASLFVLTASAHAEILATPPIYGGTPAIGGEFTCRIFNSGTTPVTINARRILINPGLVIPLSLDTCNVPLGAGKYCLFFTTGVGNNAYMCKATTVGSAAALRGLGEVQSSGHAVINTEPMR